MALCGFRQGAHSACDLRLRAFDVVPFCVQGAFDVSPFSSGVSADVSPLYIRGTINISLRKLVYLVIYDSE